jgi:hypothetical protein
MTEDYQPKSGVNEEGLNELGRRLAAAYISYISGYAGVDRVLKTGPRKVGRLWIDLADILFSAMKGDASVDDLRLADVITKYIQ